MYWFFFIYSHFQYNFLQLYFESNLSYNCLNINISSSKKLPHWFCFSSNKQMICLFQLLTWNVGQCFVLSAMTSSMMKSWNELQKNKIRLQHCHWVICLLSYNKLSLMSLYFCVLWLNCHVHSYLLQDS